MTTTDPSAASYASEFQLLSRATEALEEVHKRIGPHFRRAEVRRRVRRFLEGLLAPVERKNGWQLAEDLGECGPHGVQRLLLEADWDQEAVRDELRTYVLKYLGEEAGVLVVDETGFLKNPHRCCILSRGEQKKSVEHVVSTPEKTKTPQAAGRSQAARGYLFTCSGTLTQALLI